MGMLDKWDWELNQLGDVLCGLNGFCCVDIV